MPISIRCTVLLAGAMFMMTGTTRAQNLASSVPAHRPFTVDLGLTYAPEYARVVNSNCSCFWLQTVSGDASLNLYRGLGIAASVSEGSASNIQPGVNLRKLTLAAGPRYTWDVAAWKANAHPTRIFAQGLFGGAFGSNGVFPAASGTTSTAHSSSIQLGGGVDLMLTHGFALRVVEADWVRTALPNTASNTQNDLRLAFGVSYRMQKNK